MSPGTALALVAALLLACRVGGAQAAFDRAALLAAVNDTKTELVARPLVLTAKPDAAAVTANAIARFNATLRNKAAGDARHGIALVGPAFKGDVATMRVELTALAAEAKTGNASAAPAWAGHAARAQRGSANSSFSPVDAWGMKAWTLPGKAPPPTTPPPTVTPAPTV